MVPLTPRRRGAAAVVLAAVIAAALTAVPAGAAGHKTIRCIGNGDFCGATVSIAGGAGNRVITIQLTDTNFKRIGVRVIPPASRGAFSITRASFLLGGSLYRFTLNAVKGNPRSARIILLFAAADSVAS
jgi:hypothetical protein